MVFENVWGSVVDVVVLLVLPALYLAGAYLVLDLPGRLAASRVHFTGQGALIFVAAAAVSLLGITRLAQEASPVAPVRPRFARAMLLAGWGAALLLTIFDLAG